MLVLVYQILSCLTCPPGGISFLQLEVTWPITCLQNCSFFIHWPASLHKEQCRLIMICLCPVYSMTKISHVNSLAEFVHCLLLVFKWIKYEHISIFSKSCPHMVVLWVKKHSWLTLEILFQLCFACHCVCKSCCVSCCSS